MIRKWWLSQKGLITLNFTILKNKVLTFISAAKFRYKFVLSPPCIPKIVDSGLDFNLSCNRNGAEMEIWILTQIWCRIGQYWIKWYSSLIFCGQVFYYNQKIGTDPEYASCWYPTREKGGHLIMYGRSQTAVLQMVQMFEIAHTWLNDHPHAGLTACCSSLHQISPGHTYWKFHVPINQTFHLGMLIMHTLHAVISPFSSLSFSKLGKRSALDQREFLLHNGLIWQLYEPKPCDPFVPVPWCVPNLLHCTLWSPTCGAADCGAALVHVKQLSFRGKWTGGPAPDVQPVSLESQPHFGQPDMYWECLAQGTSPH